MPNEAFCKACRLLLSDSSQHDATRNIYQHHPDANSFQAALRLNCPLCTRLWRLIEQPTDLTGTICKGRGKGFGVQHSGQIELQFRGDSHEKGQSLASNAPWLLMRPLDENNEHALQLCLPDKTNLPLAITFFRSQLQRCHKDHQNCREASHRSRSLPSRLVDVGHLNSDSVRLCNSDQIPQGIDSRYLALSHVWGKSKHYELTRTTCNELFSGLPIVQLPKTFRHAIDMTRGMGVRYLWIDSLCIYQDDFEDWTIEAGRMRDVYSNATLTIAATSAKDSDEGLFFTRDSHTLAPFRAECSTPLADNNRQTQTYVCFFQSRNGKLPTLTLLDNQPLNQRGWVKQERHLSRRLMHFTNTLLYWECAELTNEVFPNGVPAWANPTPNENCSHLKLKINQLRYNGADQTPQYRLHHREEIYRAWCSFRTSYTRSQLSKEQDRIVALLGVASDVACFFDDNTTSVQVQLGDLFPAGLWKCFLIRELYWAHRPPTDKSSPSLSSEQQAPTWSWASTSHTIIPSFTARAKQIALHPFLASRYELAELVDMHMLSISYAEPCRGWIKLKCRPFPAILLSGEKVWWPRDEEWYGSLRVKSGEDGEVVVVSNAVILDRRSVDDEPRDISLVILQCCKKNDGSAVRYEGIAIAHSVTQPGSFERIGSFECGVGPGDLKKKQALFEALLQGLNSIDEQIVMLI